MRDIEDAAISSLPDGKYRIGDAVLDSLRNELHVRDEVKVLEPRLVRLLLTLAAGKGKPLERDALLGAVSALPFAGDEALTQAISKLRQALGDSPKVPTYIRTIPRRGYALIAPVEPLDMMVRPMNTASEAQTRQRKVRGEGRSVIILLAVAVLLLAGLLVWAQLFPKEIVRETEILLNGNEHFSAKPDQEFIERKDMPEGERPDGGAQGKGAPD